MLRGGEEVLHVNAMVERAFAKEQQRRDENRMLIAELQARGLDLAADPVLKRWAAESRPLPMPWPEDGEYLSVRRAMGDPAHVKDRIYFANLSAVKQALGSAWADENQLRDRQITDAIIVPTS